MRILGIKQPWATLIVLGHKTVENRVWTTAYRGPVLVHATLRPDPSGITALVRCVPGAAIRDLPHGQIIGVVEIYDVIAIGDPLSPQDREWFTGPFGLLLRNALRFSNGVRISGQLGLWSCTPQIAKLVRPLLNELGTGSSEQSAEVENGQRDPRFTRRED